MDFLTFPHSALFLEKKIGLRTMRGFCPLWNKASVPKPKLVEWSTSGIFSHHTVEKGDSLDCGKENMEMIPYASELLLHALHTIPIVVFGIVRLNIVKEKGTTRYLTLILYITYNKP